MNKIKGLLTKDLLELKAYKKNFILSVVIYILIIISNSNNSNFIIMGSSMIVFLFSIYSIATFSYDEKSSSNKYMLTLPLTKKDIVLSKYILVILSVLLGLITSIIIGVILYCADLIKTLKIEEMISSMLGIIFAFSIIHGLQIPCIYKYGAEKGRMQIYLIIMVVMLIIGGFYLLFPKIDFNFINKIEIVLPYIMLLLTIFNYYISYKISVKIYQKKEV